MTGCALATVIDLGPWQLAVAAGLILINAAASVALKLGLERRLLLAATRSVVQLLLLGFVLQWVFRQEGWWAVLLLMLAMGLLAGQQGAARARMVLLVFPVGLCLGTCLGLAEPTLPYPAYANLASFLVLGSLVAGAWHLPGAVVVSLAALFGVTHGYANGTAMAQGMSRLLYVPGRTKQLKISGSVPPIRMHGGSRKRMQPTITTLRSPSASAAEYRKAFPRSVESGDRMV